MILGHFLQICVSNLLTIDGGFWRQRPSLEIKADQIGQLVSRLAHESESVSCILDVLFAVTRLIK